MRTSGTHSNTRWSALLSGMVLMTGMVGKANAQCQSGEVEVTLEVATDAYGYETYWEIVPNGNGCGNGTVGSGGNTAVGCDGAGAQDQTPGGYGNSQTYTEGPWCLVEGAAYDLFWADDWGDGGGVFTVLVNGLPVDQFTGTGATATWTFVASEPPAHEAAVTKVHTFGGPSGSMLHVHAMVMNYGSEPINTLELSYSVDGGVPVTATVNDLDIAPFQMGHVEHPVPLMAGDVGYYTLAVTSGTVNGMPDAEPGNNSATREIAVWQPVPNIIDQYIGATAAFLTIATSADQLNVPRDLDFYPDLNKRQLWVVNKDTENSGGSTVTLYNAGTDAQEALWRRDGNAWHFMSLPTAIAFGTNEFFATAPGVFDANHNGPPPFTGPSLWTSDTLIYAQPSGGNGSHMDMLHCSPYSQGIAHEVDNVYWVVDGYSNDVVRYDFQEDHGPGNSYHGDAIIRRYDDDINIQKDPGDHIVSHCVLDKESGWLYVVNHGLDKVVRLDINSGTPGGTPAFGPWETVEEYVYVNGFTQEDVVTEGLVEPAGIALMEDRLLVSDHATGDIVIYDIGTMPAVELGRIMTGTPGVMGITIGPEGHVWYVNATTEEVVQVTIGNVGIDEQAAAPAIRVVPNPASQQLVVQVEQGDAERLDLLDATGRLVNSLRPTGMHTMVDVQHLPAGTYLMRARSTDGAFHQQRVIIAR